MNRILWGLRKVVAPVAACALIAIVAFALDGDRAQRPGDPSLSELLEVYIGAGFAAGLILGLLKPLTRHPVGRLVTAAIVALPVSFSVILMSIDWRLKDLTGFDIGLGIFLAALFGPFAAEYARLRWPPSKSRDA